MDDFCLRGGARSEKNVYFNLKSNCKNLAPRFQSEKNAYVFSDVTLGDDKYLSLVQYQLKWKTNLSPENETY